MKLTKLLKNVCVKKIVGKIDDITIVSLCHNACDVKKGSLFFCLTGKMFDGHNFAEKAKQNGAVCLICEKVLETDLPQIVVDSSRKAMSIIAANFYHNPQNKLKLIGITGTNGKTTTAHYVASVLNDAGIKTGIIGTLGAYFDGKNFNGTLTTPDPISLQRIFYEMEKCGAEFVVMEVSAHAIFWDKIFGLKFEVGALSNITEDHLDFFENMENYSKTKMDFLKNDYCKNLVINADDEYGKKLVLQNSKCVSYGLFNPCDVFAFNYVFSSNGTEYYLNMFDEIEKIQTTQIGKFNLYNQLCAITILKVLGMNTKDIVSGIKNLKEVCGRLNKIDLGERKTAIVDFAHTPDGLKKVLEAVREMTNKKIVCVFGCGGNRDAKKRPIMGEIAGTYANFSIITSDNPRFENPQKIISEIEEGMKKVTSNYLCINSREEAIRCGLSMLNKDDVLVVCGKGAENYIEQNGVKTYYSDFETILSLNRVLKGEKV